MNNKNFIIVTLLLHVFSSQAQVPTWAWAKNAASASNYVSSIATDLKGNVYITGSFDSYQITFGNIILKNKNFEGGTTGYEAVFLVKYDHDGNVLWAESAEGSSSVFPNCITTDIFGNVYIGGQFTGASLIIGTTTLLNNTAYTPAAFIAKYDSSGKPLWANSALGGVALSICLDHNDGVYLAGGFSGHHISFGKFNLPNINLAADDIFITKYNTSGNIIWAKSAGGTDNDDAIAVACDEENNLFVAGDFSSSVMRFGCTEFIDFQNPSYYDAALFLAKYDSSGQVIWIKGTKGDQMGYLNRVYGINIDDAGGIYLAGSAYGNVIFDNDTVLNHGAMVAFIAKYDQLGNVVWARGFGGSGDNQSAGMTTDKDKSVYVTGWINSKNMIFGKDTLKKTGIQDVFLVKFDSLANPVWGQLIGRKEYASANAITNDMKGNIYITGIFGSKAISFGNITLIKKAGQNIFVAKLNPDDCFRNQPVLKTSTDSVFCIGDSLILHAQNIPSGDSVFWYKNDSIIFSSIDTILTVKAGGFYHAVITSSGGCQTETNDINIELLMPPILNAMPDTIVCGGSSVTIVAKGLEADNPVIWHSDSSIISPATDSSITVATAGNYYAIDKCGDSSNIIHLRFDYPIKPKITPSSDTLNSTLAFAYQWYLNNAKITGANTSTWIATQTGYYQVMTTDTLGCANISDSLQIVLTGIQNPDDEPRLYAANQVLYVQIPNADFMNGKLTIFDELGKSILQQTIQSENFNLNLKLLTTGIYFVKMENNGKEVVRKIALE